VSITPLGRPVEPEVYCKNARVSSVMSGRAQAAPAEGSSSSVESHESAASSGAWGINISAKLATKAVVSTKRGWASATMPRRRGRVRARRLGSGG
jgi:hypothetical protein